MEDVAVPNLGDAGRGVLPLNASVDGIRNSALRAGGVALGEQERLGVGSGFGGVAFNGQVLVDQN